MSIDKLLQDYADKFDDNFPIFALLHIEEKEIADLIRKAIDNNEPYNGNYDAVGAY
jgi:hypothetical protein